MGGVVSSIRIGLELTGLSRKPAQRVAQVPHDPLRLFNTGRFLLKVGARTTASLLQQQLCQIMDLCGKLFVEKCVVELESSKI